MLHEEVTHEGELKTKAKRELANGLDKNSLDKLRLLCFSRGATGIMGLGRAFRVMDDDGSKSLSLEEFKKGIFDTGFDVTESEVEDMFTQFDVDGNGTISVAEFLIKLRPPINASRISIINKSFAKLDKNGDGKITVEDLKNVYSIRSHPKYLSGQLTEEEIFMIFIKKFEAGISNPDGIVTEEEFLNYYASISASIDNDGYFDLLMRRAYKL